MKIAVYVDLSNLYYSINRKWGNRKLSYNEYTTFIKGIGDVIKLKAYGAQAKSQATGFIKRVGRLGYEVKYKEPKVFVKENGGIIKKADWDVGIAVDVIKDMENEKIDLVILGSADGDMEPLVNYLIDKDIKVVVIACNIANELKKSATKCIEIIESMLEGPTETS